MYDAINKGFQKSSGDIMAWLNSDDMYHPYALETVTQIFSRFDSIDWITGIPNSYNEYGSRTGFDKFPDAYSRKYLTAGYYDVKFLSWGFNWIQQESTFWRRSLWDSIGSKADTTYKYASDFYLWQSFSKYADLVKVESFLGGYRSHEDQITATPELYIKELPKRLPPAENLKKVYQEISKNSSTKQKFFDKKSPLLKDLDLNREDLIGRVVFWSFQNKSWELTHKAIF